MHAQVTAELLEQARSRIQPSVGKQALMVCFKNLRECVVKSIEKRLT